jgi:hypothetical protein
MLQSVHQQLLGIKVLVCVDESRKSKHPYSSTIVVDAAETERLTAALYQPALERFAAPLFLAVAPNPPVLPA